MSCHPSQNAEQIVLWGANLASQPNTARRFADIILPSTAWLEQLGCKSTNTHLYLMEPALPPPGETRPLSWILQR